MDGPVEDVICIRGAWNTMVPLLNTSNSSCIPFADLIKMKWIPRKTDEIVQARDNGRNSIFYSRLDQPLQLSDSYG